MGKLDKIIQNEIKRIETAKSLIKENEALVEKGYLTKEQKVFLTKINKRLQKGINITKSQLEPYAGQEGSADCALNYNGSLLEKMLGKYPLVTYAFLKQSFEGKKLADSYYDQLLRLKAEFDNYRKRIEKEKEELVKFGKEELVVKLFDILDSFDLALSSTKDEKNEAKSIKEGIKLIYKQFKETLEKEGLKKLKVLGERFDPNLHYAVEYQESDKHKDDEIIKEIRPGYLLYDRVIRPAMVVVAKAKQNKE